MAHTIVLEMDTDILVNAHVHRAEVSLHTARNMLQSAQAPRCISALYEAREKLESAIRAMENAPVRASPTLGITPDGYLAGTGLASKASTSRSSSNSPPAVPGPGSGVASSTSPRPSAGSPHAPLITSPLAASSSSPGPVFGTPPAPFGGSPATAHFNASPAAAFSPVSPIAATTAVPAAAAAAAAAAGASGAPLRRTNPLSRSLTDLGRLRGPAPAIASGSGSAWPAAAQNAMYGTQPPVGGFSFSHPLAMPTTTSSGSSDPDDGAEWDYSMYGRGAGYWDVEAEADHDDEGDDGEDERDGGESSEDDEHEAESPVRLEMGRRHGRWSSARASMDGGRAAAQAKGLRLGVQPPSSLSFSQFGTGYAGPGSPTKSALAPALTAPTRKRRLGEDTDVGAPPEAKDTASVKSLKLNSYSGSDANAAFVAGADERIQEGVDTVSAMTEAAAGSTPEDSTGVTMGGVGVAIPAQTQPLSAFVAPTATASTIQLTLPNPPMRSYPDPAAVGPSMMQVQQQQAMQQQQQQQQMMAANASMSASSFGSAATATGANMPFSAPAAVGNGLHATNMHGFNMLTAPALLPGTASGAYEPFGAPPPTSVGSLGSGSTDAFGQPVPGPSPPQVSPPANTAPHASFAMAAGLQVSPSYGDMLPSLSPGVSMHPGSMMAPPMHPTVAGLGVSVHAMQVQGMFPPAPSGIPVYAAGQATAYLPPQTMQATNNRGARGRAASMSAFPSGSGAGFGANVGFGPPAAGPGANTAANVGGARAGALPVAGSMHLPTAGQANANELGPELRNTIDELFFEYLGEVCSDLNCQDAKGEPIHQTLMAKKMQRLDESPDYRPFRFRIQAFTNRFIDLLATRGFPEDKLPTKKVRHYLWTHPYIARYNEVGKKSKSKGNHIWSVDARKVPQEERVPGGAVWVFRHFERRIAGTPSTVAYVGVKWSFAPRVWDPQAPRVGADINWSSPDGGLPSWMRWERHELVGTPAVGDEGGEVHITASFEENGAQVTLHHKFNITVAPVGAEVQPTSPTRSRRPTVDGAGGPARRGSIEGPVASTSRRNTEHTVEGSSSGSTSAKPKRARRDSLLGPSVMPTLVPAPNMPQLSPVASGSVEQPVALGTQVKHVLDVVTRTVNQLQHDPTVPDSARAMLHRQEQVLLASNDPDAAPPLVQAAQSTVLKAAQHLQAEGASVVVQTVALATQAAVANAVLLTGGAASEVEVMQTADRLQGHVPPGTFGVSVVGMPQQVDGLGVPVDVMQPAQPVAVVPLMEPSGMLVDQGMLPDPGLAPPLPAQPAPMLVPAVPMPHRVQELSMQDAVAHPALLQQQQAAAAQMAAMQEQAAAHQHMAMMDAARNAMPPPQDIVMRQSTPMPAFIPPTAAPQDFGIRSSHMPLL